MNNLPTYEEIRCASELVTRYRQIFKANNITADQASEVLTEEDYNTYCNCVSILRRHQIAKRQHVR